MSSSNTDNPGLVTGHAKLAQGVAQSALGSLIGNENLQSSGEEVKQAGVSELKAYQDQNPPSGNGSSVEQKVGQAVGCEGMVNDATGSTTSSTTGSSIDPDNIGGASQPGKGTGGADPAASKDLPERSV